MLEKRLLAEALAWRGTLALLGLGSLAGALGAVWQAALLAAIVDGAFLQGLGREQLLPQLVALALAFAWRVLAFWGGEACGARLAAAVKTSLRARLAARLLAQGPVRGAGEATGELLSVLGEGVEQLEAYFVRYLPGLFAAAAVPLAILAVVAPRDWPSALLLLGTAPLIPAFMVLIGRLAAGRTQRQWARLQRLGAQFYDVLQGLVTLKLFGRSRQAVTVVARASEDFRAATLDVLKVVFLSALALELIAAVGTALVAVAVGLRLLQGSLLFSDAFFVLLLAPEFYQPLRQLGAHFHAGQAGQAAAARLYALLAAEEEAAVAPEDPWPGEQAVRVDVEDVSFAYGEGEPAVLAGLSFSLAPGETTALVGASGAGKSTVAALLLGMARPGRGGILINGIPLTAANRDAWLRRVAYVPQHPHLFRASLQENIRLARPQASLAQVQAALRRAGGEELAASLPRGYDTLLGEGGVELSGGERRRVALARAFLADAPFLLCDEATGGLDPAAEAQLQAAFADLCRGRTVLVIAHRLGTVRRAARILLLADGAVAEAGTHAELLARQGRYASLAAVPGGGA